MATSERLLPHHQQHHPHPPYQQHQHHSQYQQHQHPSSSPLTTHAYQHDPATHYQQQPPSPGPSSARGYLPDSHQAPSGPSSPHSHRSSIMQESHQYAAPMASQQQQHLRHNQSYPAGQHPRSQSQQHSFQHPPPTQAPPPLPQQHHANIKPSASAGGDRQNRPPAPPTYQPRLHHSYSAGNIALAAANSKNAGGNNAGAGTGGSAQAAPKKKDPYATAWRTYSKIAEELDLANPDGSLYPISKESILKYLHHQSKRIKSSNLHWYVNGLKKHQENLGFPWDEVRYDEEVVALLKELTLHPVMQHEREAKENREAANNNNTNDDDRQARGRQRQASGASGSYSSISAQQQQSQHQYQHGSGKHDPMAYLQQPPTNFQPTYGQSSSSRTSQSPSQRTYFHSAPIQIISSSSTMSPQNSSSGNGGRRTDGSHPAATRHYTSQPINTASIHAALAASDKSVPPIDTRAEYMQSTLSKRKRFESMKRRVPSPMSPGDEEDELQEDELRDDDEDSRISRHGRGVYDDDDDEQMEDSSQYQPLKRRASTGTLLNQARAQAVNHVPGPYDLNKLRAYKGGEAERGGDESGYDAGLNDRVGYYSSHTGSIDPASPPTSSSSMFRRPPTERTPQSPPQGGLAQSSFGSSTGSQSAGASGKTTVQFTQVVDCAQRLQAKYGGRCSDHPWGCVELPNGEHLELTIKMYLDWAGLVASGRLTMDELPDLVEFKRAGGSLSDYVGSSRDGGDERSGVSVVTSGGSLKRMSSTPMGFHSQQASIDSRYQGSDDHPMSPTSPTAYSQQDQASGYNTSLSTAHSRAMFGDRSQGYSDHQQINGGGHRNHSHSHSHHGHPHHHHQREASDGYRRSPHRTFSSSPRHPLPSPPPNYNSPPASQDQQPMSFTSAGMGIGSLDGDSTALSSTASGREAKARRMASSPSLGRNHREFFTQPLTIPVFNFAAGAAAHLAQHQPQDGEGSSGDGTALVADEQQRHHSNSPQGGSRAASHGHGLSTASTPLQPSAITINSASRGGSASASGAGGAPPPHSSVSSMSSENEVSDDDMDGLYGGHRHRLRSPMSRLSGQPPTMKSFGDRSNRRDNADERDDDNGDGGEGNNGRIKSPPTSGSGLKNLHVFKVTSSVHQGDESRGLHHGGAGIDEDLEREVNEIGEIGNAATAHYQGRRNNVANDAANSNKGTPPAGFYEGIQSIQSTDPAFGQGRLQARTRTRSGEEMEEEEEDNKDDEEDDDEYDEDVGMSSERNRRGHGPSSSSSRHAGGGPGPHHSLHEQHRLPYHHPSSRSGMKKEDIALADQLHHQHQVDSLTERANTITLAPAASLPSSSSSSTSPSPTTAPGHPSPPREAPTTASTTHSALKTAAGAHLPTEGYHTMSARAAATSTAAENGDSEAMEED